MDQKQNMDSGEEGSSSAEPLSRYEAQKSRDWTTFLQYLKNHKPPLSLPKCSSANVIEFMKYLDQFGKTKVHVPMCSYYGCLSPSAVCACPVRQAWGSLDALIGRLRAAYEENGGQVEMNPFGGKGVRIYLKGVRDEQGKARGISYEKKRKRVSVESASVQTRGAEEGGDLGGDLGGEASNDYLV